ncbi:glycosyltransferase [Vibrio splendidus]|uniref:glycosyltransferase n=1 Tax=Vibrio splendidus TaxID=29497 RepID=UPI000769AE52|nr:glycosyltransferase [Vibrio splendidus]PHX05720.1 Glycosyl transferase family 2 [Vibrio splendidus]
MKPKLLILVVNYNLDLKLSATINSLIKSRDILSSSDVLIWENGPISSSNSSVEFLNTTGVNFHYRFSRENKGLSYIYNTVIREYVSNYDYLVILDNDSIFDSEFFSSINKAISYDPEINLLVPLIKHEEKLISPSNLNFIFMERWQSDEVGKISSVDRFAINSGMVIKSSFLLNEFPGYNELIKFYGTDDDFFNKYSKINKYFYVLDYVFSHDFSMFSEQTLDKELFRFKERCTAYRYVYSSSFLKGAFLKVYLFLVALKLAFKFRSLRFLI